MSTYSNAVMADSPNGYWKLRDLTDASGFANNMTLGGGTPPTLGVPTIVTNEPDGAALFTGAGLLQSSTAATKFNLGDVLTVEAWIQRRQATGDGMMGIVSKVNNAYYVRVNGTSNKIEFLKSQVASITTSTVTIVDTNPHHIVVTKNAATVKVYVDAVDVTGTVTNATLADNASTLRIGYDLSADPANMVIDEVAIYPTALSLARVQAHYNAGLLAPTATGALGFMHDPKAAHVAALARHL